ncbi:MAG: T9SS type A sorting domain-containing protein [Flavobacteriales bacterium]
MSKKITLIMAACISVLSAFSQIPVWTEGYGSGSFILNINSSELGSDQKFLISGDLYGSIAFAQNYTLGNETISTPALPYQGGWRHGFYAKLDTNGVISDVNFASPPTDEQYVDHVSTLCASQDNTGNIFAGGSTNRNTNIFGSSTGTIPGGNRDAYVSKNDANGNPLWLKVFGGSVIDEVYAIQFSDDGRIYVAGTFRGDCDFDTIQKTSTDGWSDGFIAEIDTDGNFLWVKSIGGINSNYTKELEIDSEGNLYTATTFVENYELEDGTSYTAPHGIPGVVIIKMDSDGNTLWTNHSFGTALNVYMDPVEMKVSDDGKVWVGMQHGDMFITQEGDEYPRLNSYNATCLIIDTNGTTYNVIAPQSEENTWFTGIGMVGDGMMMPSMRFEDNITISGEEITKPGNNIILPVMTANGDIDGYGTGNNLGSSTYLHFQSESLYVISTISGNSNSIEGMNFPSGMNIGMAKLIGNNQPEIFTETLEVEQCADAESFSFHFNVEDPEHEEFTFSAESENNLVDINSLEVIPGFGDGEFIATIDVLNTEHTSTELTVKANDGYSDGEVILNLNLMPTPELSLESEVVICPGDEFIQNAISNAEVSWNNGVDNGTTWYPEQSASLTVTAINANGCIINANLDLTVYPVADLEEVSDYSLCLGQNVLLNANSNESSVIWSNGVTNGSSYAPQATEEATVTVTSIHGCESSQTIDIVVHPLPIVNAGEDISICFGEATSLNATHNGVIGNWNQQVIDGVQFTPEESMGYTFEATNEFSCVASDEVFIEIKELPVISELSDVAICQGQGVILEIIHDGASGSWNDDYEIDQQVFPEDSQEFTFTAIGANECQTQTSFMATVHANPAIDMPLDTEVCAGSEYLLNAISDEDITWSDNYSNNSSIIVSNNLTLEAIATNSFGCVTTELLSITALELPFVDAGQDMFVCPGDGIILNGSGDGMLEWNVGQENQTEYFLTEEEVLVLTATAANGCVAQDEMVVALHALPEVELSFENGVLTATGAMTFQWYFNGELISGIEANSFEPLENGEYQVIGYSEIGCSNYSEVMDLTISSIDEKNPASQFVFYPNPASDHVIVQADGDNSHQLEIFNLEGKLILSENLNSGKNSVQISHLASGVYVMKMGLLTKRIIVK